MKVFFIVVCCLLTAYCGLHAQVHSGAPVSRPKPAEERPDSGFAGSSILARPYYTDIVDSAVENRLVLLALNGPEYSLSNHQNKIAELELKRAKSTWLNLLSISTNYNDQTFAKSSNGQSAYVYPKYYFGVTIPLGIIFSQGTQVRLAREGLAVSRDKQEINARAIKADILGKYKQYRLYNTTLTMQSEMINDVLANAAQAEENFKKGTIPVEAYIAVQKIKNEELSKNMNLQLQQDLIRLDIEKIIGVSLETVLWPEGRNNSKLYR